MTSVSLDRIAQAFGMDAPKESDSHQYATVDSVNVDGSYQVQMNGALSTVRAAKLCDAEIGDRVMCVVHDGQVAAIGRVGGELPHCTTLYTGTITKTYSSNGFTLENDKFYELGGVVTIPIQFAATSNCAPGSCASIPSSYAPPKAMRFALFSTNVAWSSFPVSYLTIATDGTITLTSSGNMAAWFGVATYVRG